MKNLMEKFFVGFGFGWLFLAGALAFFNFNLLTEFTLLENVIPPALSGVVMLFIPWED